MIDKTMSIQYAPLSQVAIEVRDEVNIVLRRDFVGAIKSSSGTAYSCARVAAILAIFSTFMTCIASVLAFAAGFYPYDALSFVSGCSSVIAIVFIKLSYYADKQSHFYETKLKSLLTEDFRFLNSFYSNPLEMPEVHSPILPDPDFAQHSPTPTKPMVPQSTISTE